MQRLGVLGGTFDPIHQGHLALAKQAREAMGLDSVLILPMARPGHREAVASADQRMEMCRLAIEGQEGLLLSSAGIMGSVRYTSDTLDILRREYPNASFSFILGADKLPTLPYWHEADRLFTLCDFLCFARPGIMEEDALEKAKKAGAKVRMLPAPQLPYSSTMIRNQISRYEDAAGVPEKVLYYIAENGLYLPDYLPKLKMLMNPRRFKHTLGVRREAVRLARMHGLPLMKAAVAGLLHDCAKGMPLPNMVQIAKERRLVADDEMLSSGAMLHGPVGAYVAKEKFGIQDLEILSAIYGHTIGRPGMSLLDLCVFVADVTEAGRESYEGLEKMRRLSDVSLPAAALLSIRHTQAYVEKSGRPFFAAARDTANYLENILSEQERSWL